MYGINKCTSLSISKQQGAYYIEHGTPSIGLRVLTPSDVKYGFQTETFLQILLKNTCTLSYLSHNSKL